MRFYLDCEFNGFGGELLSLGLAPANPALGSFYVILESNEPVQKWVKENVMPYLGDGVRYPRNMAARLLATYMHQIEGATSERMTIVADWPEDFSHFMNLLLTGPGNMVSVPDFDCEYRSMRGFNTADHSAIPHNAKADAEALRDYWEGVLAKD